MKTNRTPEKIAAGMTLGVALFLGAAAAGAYEAEEQSRDLAASSAAAHDPELAQEAAYFAVERQWLGDRYRNGALLAAAMGTVIVGSIAGLRRGQTEATPLVRTAPIELTIEAQYFSGNDYVAGNQARAIQTV